MLTNPAIRTAKISRDVSNFIITQVLERSDDLIKNSYRRLTTENVARNEHWSRIAEKVAEKFEIPAEMERVKSHFHNRKKVLLARIKDELRTVPNSASWTTEEKLDELVRRRICIGEYDEQLARVCLDIEEEEKGRADTFGNDQTISPMLNLFAETSHQSLLTQLLSSSGSNSSQEKHVSKTHTPPMECPSSKESEPQIPKVLPATRAPLLSKLLSESASTKENGISPKVEDPRMNTGPSAIRNPSSACLDRKNCFGSPLERNNRSSVLPSPNAQYLSHLIVDVSSPQELKRLLSILIDNGFSRFQHVANSDMLGASIRDGIQRESRKRNVDYPSNEALIDDSFYNEQSTYWSNPVPENGKIAVSMEYKPEGLGVTNAMTNRLDAEVKLEPFGEDDEEFEEDVDEQTSELEAQLALEARRNGLALFGRPPSPKRMKTNGSTTNVICGDIVTANCEMCGTVIRLNSGGSKWNFYEHVMMKHSVHKPFKCPHCPYQAGRKVRVKHHGVAQHNVETEPIDMITPEIKNEWLKTMSVCFPHHQYGKTQQALK